MRRLAAIAIAAAALAGCGEKHASARVGETLGYHDIAVTVQRFDPNTPAKDDLSGLGRPLPGDHLVGARVRACVKAGAAIGPSAFGLDVDGGHWRVKFPSSNYADDFASVFGGDPCGEGWLVFEVSDGARVKAVTLRYDDTGSNAQHRRATHARFRWNV